MTRCSSSLCLVTIVIDEANIAFNKRGSEEETQAALELFTALTKEERKVRARSWPHRSWHRVIT
jgi:hypothetical protein